MKLHLQSKILLNIIIFSFIIPRSTYANSLDDFLFPIRLAEKFVNVANSSEDLFNSTRKDEMFKKITSATTLFFIATGLINTAFNYKFKVGKDEKGKPVESNILYFIVQHISHGISNLKKLDKSPEVPKGLILVKPKSATNPDGAVTFNELLHDPFDQSSAKIRSTFESISRGEPIKNGIYYGDAGTGKSASVKAFAHLPNVSVYSINSDTISLEKFEEITKWLKAYTNKNRRVIIDFSEGDDLLVNIAIKNPKFKRYFKQNYDREQANFALIFSCNYNFEVSNALKVISKEEELRRRFEDRIQFQAPSIKVRLSLLRSSVDATIQRQFQKDSDLKDFFYEGIFSNRDILIKHIIPTTEAMSHSRIQTLGEKLVYLYIDARNEQNQGVNDNISDFDFIDNVDSTTEEPLNRILTFLYDKHEEITWLKNQKLKFMDELIDEIEEDIPLLEKQREIANIHREIEMGNYKEREKKPKLSFRKPDNKKSTNNHHAPAA